MDPLSGSVYAVVVPRSVSLPRHDGMREMALNRLTSGPSADEILKARMIDHDIGDVIVGPAVFRAGVIDNLVFCVCGRWRSALCGASFDPEHEACGAG